MSDHLYIITFILFAMGIVFLLCFAITGFVWHIPELMNELNGTSQKKRTRASEKREGRKIISQETYLKAVKQMESDDTSDEAMRKSVEKARKMAEYNRHSVEKAKARGLKPDYEMTMEDIETDQAVEDFKDNLFNHNVTPQPDQSSYSQYADYTTGYTNYPTGQVAEDPTGYLEDNQYNTYYQGYQTSPQIQAEDPTGYLEGNQYNTSYPNDQFDQTGTASEEEQPTGYLDESQSYPANQIGQPSNEEQPTGYLDESQSYPYNQIEQPSNEEQPTGYLDERQSYPSNQIGQPSNEEQPTGYLDERQSYPANQIGQPSNEEQPTGYLDQDTEIPTGFLDQDTGYMDQDRVRIVLIEEHYG